jgi:hypothetical protein
MAGFAKKLIWTFILRNSNFRAAQNGLDVDSPLTRWKFVSTNLNGLNITAAT